MRNNLVGDAFLRLMLQRVEAEREPDPEKRSIEAQRIFIKLMALAADLMGPELLADVYGTINSQDRGDVLQKVALRAMMAGMVFAKLPTDAGSLDEVTREAVAVRGGDAPLLFARLPTRKTADRVLRIKLRAHLWNAYLEGREVPTVERQAEIAKSFGHSWDTISRWLKPAIDAFGNDHVEYLLLAARVDGCAGKPFNDGMGRFPDLPVDEPWQITLRRSGERFLTAQRANLGNV
jgi:hypothetical protein